MQNSSPLNIRQSPSLLTSRTFPVMQPSLFPNGQLSVRHVSARILALYRSFTYLLTYLNDRSPFRTYLETDEFKPYYITPSSSSSTWNYSLPAPLRSRHLTSALFRRDLKTDLFITSTLATVSSCKSRRT